MLIYRLQPAVRVIFFFSFIYLSHYSLYHSPPHGTVASYCDNIWIWHILTVDFRWYFFFLFILFVRYWISLVYSIVVSLEMVRIKELLLISGCWIKTNRIELNWIQLLNALKPEWKQYVVQIRWNESSKSMTILGKNNNYSTNNINNKPKSRNIYSFSFFVVVLSIGACSYRISAVVSTTGNPPHVAAPLSGCLF